MKLVNIEIIKDELERLIRNYRFYSSTEAKYRYEAYKELSEWLDDVTEKGANYTVFCPLGWKSAFSPAKLRKLLKEDVDADIIKVEYIDFVKEEIEDKTDKVWNVDYF